MVEWQDFFRKTVVETKKPDSTFNAGEWCKYCPVRGNCRARLMRTVELAYLDQPLETVPEELIAVMYNEIASLKTHIEAIQARAVELARTGVPIKGNKLVQSIQKAKCSDTEAFAEAAIAEGVERGKLYHEKLKSMTDCKKVASVGLVNKYFVKPPSSTTLVPLSNSRIAVSVLAQQQVDATGMFNPVGTATTTPDATGIFKKVGK
jgi:hypothetical protein